MTTLKVGSIEHPDGGSNTVNFGGTAGIQIPSGTTAQRPSSPSAGYSRYNTTLGSVEFYNGSIWVSTNFGPEITAISGTIYEGETSTITVSTVYATDTIDVIFKEGATTLATVEDVTVTGGSASVTVPSAVYNQTAGDTIAVSFENSDGTLSGNSLDITISALPSGGTLTTSGNYRIHTFTTSSDFVIPSGMTLTNVDYLVVAGGGGGGINLGGGGGAGGLRSSLSNTGGGGSVETAISSLSAGTYTVTVGAGGAAATTFGTGNSGTNSTFSTITSTGGGRGGWYDEPHGTSGASGGSGGGGGVAENGSPGLGGSGTSGQGRAGGAAGNRGGGGTYPGSGGGGGAGAVGSAYSGNNGGAGGAGVTNSISGSSVSYGGGGGGNGYQGTGGAGGTGGGGAGGSGLSGTPGSGSANTGGGGGGGGASSQTTSGAGGSGVVIVRYQL